jgi:two-component system phosphate regulon sensor histidine kinase PhoR
MANHGEPSASIFRKLLLAALLLIVVALGSVGLLLARYTAARELQHAEQQMESAIRILGPPLAAIDPARLPEWTRLAADQSRSRVTVIDHTGVVLADSQGNAATMENHAGRPEVREALAGRTGTAVRHSATLDLDFCYLAEPAALTGQAGAVLRLAVPLEQVRVSVAEVRWLVLRASLFAALLALPVAYFVSRSFTGRIRRIQSFATDLVNAEYSGTVAIESDDELGSVARSLREMAEQFRGMLRRLQEESSLRQAILGSMVEGVVAVDRDLHVTFWNDSLARSVKARTPVPEHLPLLQLVRDPALLDLFRDVLASGKSARRRLAMVAADGRVFEAQTAPLDERGQSGAIAILHDVTEVERLERVRKDFVANISHELRTPLAAIRGYAETLLDGALEDPENARKFLQIICARTVQLSDMASDLLALSELDVERAAPPVERVSVKAAADAALRSVETEAAARDLKPIQSEVADLYIQGQRFRLEQILVNLLHNAIRYNRPGGEVTLRAAPIPNGGIQISVTDTGWGIPSVELPRIFERFYRVDKARTRESGGTGLGLAIVKHMVEGMSGTVTVESKVGAGSTFTLLFPAA